MKTSVHNMSMPITFHFWLFITVVLVATTLLFYLTRSSVLGMSWVLFAILTLIWVAITVLAALADLMSGPGMPNSKY